MFSLLKISELKGVFLDGKSHSPSCISGNIKEHTAEGEAEGEYISVQTIIQIFFKKKKKKKGIEKEKKRKKEHELCFFLSYITIRLQYFDSGVKNSYSCL